MTTTLNIIMIIMSIIIMMRIISITRALHDHKHHHKHHESHKHHEDHHKHHEDHHMFENHDHEPYKSFDYHFESPPVHEEFILSEESATISVTPPLKDVLKITKSPKVRESVEHTEIAQV